jgi:ribosomal protein S18 acetylase RimI-like enzyme
MQFELTEALIDNILFSMEDQDGEFWVDTREGVVISENDEDFEDDEDDNGDENRYINLPEWESSDGFRLMEHFAVGLRNPVLRTELSSALNRGKGVFRAFKDIIGRYPEAEKLWFAHKEREMKRQIIRWYNSLREEWGLARIGGEPEDTADLVLEDFRFRYPEEGDTAAVEELHRICIGEYQKYAAENGIEACAGDWLGRDSPQGTLLDQEGRSFPAAGLPADPTSSSGVRRNCSTSMAAGLSVGLMAETGGGEFAGYISAVREGLALHIKALEVQPEYRGLGIGEALVSRFLEKAAEEELGREPITRITIDLPAGAEGFSRVLLRFSFKPYATRYCVTLPIT